MQFSLGLKKEAFSIGKYWEEVNIRKSFKGDSDCCFLIVKCKTKVSVGRGSKSRTLGNPGKITSQNFPIQKMENKILIVPSFIYEMS